MKVVFFSTFSLCACDSLFPKKLYRYCGNRKLPVAYNIVISQGRILQEKNGARKTNIMRHNLKHHQCARAVLLFSKVLGVFDDKKQKPKEKNT